ncbi:unnamed protein product [Rotaria magnacalcarata]|uniref:PARP-type domain-containing protein n=1 Tax=Rotaria magnacalcarata TaxID=392030 RepID=A0A816NDY9_9BILA|nr:unnamed protein product [Rotaria magnacalcarata]CAF1589661.1 unnamed protein product [Rotaria magnacalcarata]CAF1925700.1 unnamed protein product [Rotaria magnacalcarata]CAF1971663.1 unnamed protein product [Rotaria magnacalcarata]CAF2035050.1 unnamed protein product [Rotaria magnacalcarata]
MLKRFNSSELGESANRRVSYDCTTDYAKSSKSKCRVCNKIIEQNELRLALMLQDDEGYKNTAWNHYDCFWKHPETKKLNGIEEIHNFSTLKPEDQAKISTAFKDFNQTKRAREED